MGFKTILTAYGLGRVAAAQATGSNINLTHMAVGDGNGNPVLPPEESQTALVRERYRAKINRLAQDATTPNRFVAELIVPAGTGGFTIREVGLFDDAGGLFAVANTPDTYKPTATEGAISDTVIRLTFFVTNASVVTLMIDPNVAVATQSWVQNNVNACLIIPGGTTGQVLRKASNACGDTEWADPSDVNVTVDIIEETQTLAAGQTQVDLTLTTTNGLAVYIEGARLRNDQWTAHATILTRLALAQSYPAGTKLVAVQNEPAGALIDPLIRGQNLADLPNKDTARTNLGVLAAGQTVENGTGIGQDTAAKVKLGANGSGGILATINTTDMGELALKSWATQQLGTKASKTGDTFSGQVTINTGATEAAVAVVGGSKPAAYLLSNSSSWGLWSSDGGTLVNFDRSTGKKYFDGIDSGLLVLNNSGTYSINIIGSAGYARSAGYASSAGYAPVTTSQVLNATAGAAAGGVGTYVFGAIANNDLTIGSVYAGSSILPSGVYATSVLPPDTAASGTESALVTGRSYLTGSWMAMGSIHYSKSNLSRATLFLRIA